MKIKYSPNSFKDYIVLISSIVICNLTGVVGALTTQTGLSIWYTELAKPFFNPPNWIFGPVWTILYILIGVSIYLVYKNHKIKNKIKNRIYVLFLIQLILNGIWTPVFFGMQEILLGFIIILLLDIFLFIIAYFYHKYNRISFYLWIPYILWVSFAMILNLSIYILN